MRVNFSPSTVKAIMSNKRKTLPISSYKATMDELLAQELYAKDSLGITANYMSVYNPHDSLDGVYNTLLRHLDLSKLINQRLLSLKQQGYKLPDVILGTTFFEELRKLHPLAQDFKGVFDPVVSPKTIFINPFSYDSADVTTHEVGHFLHCRNFLDVDKFCNLAYSGLVESEKKCIYTEIPKVFLGMPFHDILKRYNYLSKNIGEFIAFYFTEVTKGKSLPVGFFEIYQKYRGPNIIPQL